MKIYCEGIAKILHKDTGVIYEIHSEDLDWEQVDGDDRPMGDSFHYQAQIEHEDLGLLSWDIWEYPIGAENSISKELNGHELIENFSYGLEHEPEEDDEEYWGNEDIPKHPFAVFTASEHEATNLVKHMGTHNGNDLLNRMVFSHYITAMEAYLGDTLLNQVFDDTEAMNRLLSKATELSSQTFSLAQISDQADIVNHHVQKYLRAIIYHNLSKVDKLYEIALNLKIIPLMRDKDNLFKAIQLRHDCVHRNGHDIEGKELNVFTKDFVLEIGSEVRHFVCAIEVALMARGN